MNKKLSLLIALALTATALSSCNMPSGGDRTDDLRVDREGGDYKHEYGDDTDAPTVTTTTETTEADPTPSPTPSPTPAPAKPTWEGNTVSSFQDVCDMSVSALGYDIDTSFAIVETAFDTKLILNDSEYHTEDEEDYDETIYIFFYDCDISIDGITFDTVTFCCYEDMSVYEVSYIYHSSDSSELMSRFEYCKSELYNMFGKPGDSAYDDEHILSSVYSSVNGVTYSTYYMYWGEDNDYNVTILGFDLE